jgi:hypothetical protein
MVSRGTLSVLSRFLSLRFLLRQQQYRTTTMPPTVKDRITKPTITATGMIKMSVGSWVGVVVKAVVTGAVEASVVDDVV